jgi:hypothetical protein
MKRFLIVIPVVLFIILAACGSDNTVNPDVGTMVAQTQTAKMVTATPTTTHVPSQAAIVNALNGALRGADPLEEGFDARFNIIDIVFEVNGNPPFTDKIIIHIECEYVYKQTCTAERSFVVLMHVFQKEGVRNKVIEQIPETIKTVQVKVFDNRNNRSQIGVVEALWQDVLAYGKGEITGDQLAVRAKRLTP